MKVQWLKEFLVAGIDARFERQLDGQSILNKEGNK
jgi:hypothetical protein